MNAKLDPSTFPYSPLTRDEVVDERDCLARVCADFLAGGLLDSARLAAVQYEAYARSQRVRLGLVRDSVR